jgi:hypothetical protein
MIKNSLPFDNAAIELGKKILAEFEKGDDRGILTNWMAHHVADLIMRAEDARGTPAEKEVRHACVEAILSLWARRNSFPIGCRPFESAEQAVQTLVMLNPDFEQNFYFRPLAPVGESADENALRARVWLGFAQNFDKAAREFFRICMSQSVGTSATSMRDWIEASHGLEDEPVFDIQIVSGLIESASDQELEQISNPDVSKSTRVVVQLDKIIESLTALRDTVATQTDDDEVRQSPILSSTPN